MLFCLCAHSLTGKSPVRGFEEDVTLFHHVGLLCLFVVLFLLIQNTYCEEKKKSTRKIDVTLRYLVLQELNCILVGFPSGDLWACRNILSYKFWGLAHVEVFLLLSCLHLIVKKPTRLLSV